MRPAVTRPRSPSGEATVFESLRDHPGTECWLVWHGLSIRHHDTDVDRDTDFVTTVPGEGILVVEVKLHAGISVDDEGWRFGGAEPTTRSPYYRAWTPVAASGIRSSERGASRGTRSDRRSDSRTSGAS
uniref:nuclease-related domain-containing protein n=1 Tax=Agrococcus chionoecetis TaxID=3153752 RepID=UPI003F50BD90